MKLLTKSIILLSTLIFFSCKKEVKHTSITVANSLDLPRSFETVTIPVNKINFRNEFKHFSVVDEKGDIQVSQEITQGGNVVSVLFQPKLKANETKTYTVVEQIETDKKDTICYSRFVPERTDDYAWENDKVAFRVYGPTAQKMKEDGVDGGTLSSGIDCWLKRVEYPIINKWYKKYADKTGTYHVDTGEGLDNYHVGVSRGVGGISVKSDGKYYNSKNFISYKTLATGSIRTQFSLEYANWDANGKKVTETRLITLDKGSNLTRNEIQLKGVDAISIGLTLHKNDGQITKNKENGFISYWEKLGDSELGTGIVLPNLKNIIGFDYYENDKDEVKNQYVQIKVTNDKVVYYNGFGWKKSKQFSDSTQWNTYLAQFSKRLKNPLKVIYK